MPKLHSRPTPTQRSLAAIPLFFFAILNAAAEDPGIADNSFLVEEAYNQPAGVVQHIQS